MSVTTPAAAAREQRQHTAPAATRGRTRITQRALTRVVAAVAADVLRVDVRRVTISLADDRGSLVLVVSAPIRLMSLRRVEREPDALARTGGTVIERGARAQDEIRDRVRRLTGSQIARVTVRLTAAEIREEERVR